MGAPAGTRKNLPFEAVRDATEIKALWTDACKASAPTLIWPPEHDEPLHTHLKHLSESQKLVYFLRPSRVDPRTFGERLDRGKSRSCVMSVSLARATFFFKSEYVGAAPAGLQFQLPEKIFKIQRRKSLRHRIPEGYLLRVEFLDPEAPEEKISVKVHDLSPDGLSFVVTDYKAAIYHKGMLLPGMKLTVRTRKIEGLAEVMNTSVLPKGGRERGVRVGIRFVDLPNEQAGLLKAYVDEELQRYYAKLL